MRLSERGWVVTRRSRVPTPGPGRRDSLDRHWPPRGWCSYPDRAELCHPVSQALLHHQAADIADRLLVEAFDDLEGERLFAVHIPCALERLLCAQSLSEREPMAVLDLREVRRSAEP